ncbi:MAG: hypothetical protein JWM87_3008 [Candidatus Eremiobacteraeota bacterium]|nr:hypothetical protein [Candidatus Eremiobacteraeota bacterium]
MRPGPPEPDIIVDRPEGLLLVEVKQRINDRDLSFFVDQLERYVEATHRAVPAFSLIVDPVKMRFYRGTDSEALVETLSTRDVLSRYDREFGHHPIYESYLVSLVQSWINDLALTGIDEFPSEVKKLPDELQKMLAA